MVGGFSGFDNIDLTAMVSSDFFRMDVACDKAQLYKYLNFQDRDFTLRFLRNPTVKFATKDQLNDPFDLTRRFERFGAEMFRKFAARYIQRYVDERITDVEFLVGEFQKRPEFASLKLTRQQARQILSSSRGQIAIGAMAEQMRSQIPLFLEMVFDYADQHLDTMFDEAILGAGVLSLCEQNNNKALWSLYAGAGNGFALDFDAQHEFFITKRNNGEFRNRILKMHYRDDRIPDIWTNPYYLFGIKNSDFAFEREWRCLRQLDECDQVELSEGNIIHTVSPPRGLIKGVIFGYRWTPADIDLAKFAIREFDDTISISSAIPNSKTGEIDIIRCD